MPPRRERQSPDPLDREMRRRGRKVTNPEMERQMRDLRARLEDMETTQRHTVGARDLSDSDSEIEAEREEKLQPKMHQMSDRSKLLPGWVQKQRWTFQFTRETWMQRSY